MPELLIIAGPNGAGKTTAAHVLLPEILPNARYINADYIAAGMNPLAPERSAIAAGRVMLKEIKSALKNNEDFAFETTLATRGFVNLIQEAKQKNYTTRLVYFCLPNPETAVERVAKRVRMGGHDVPEAVIRRRFTKSRQNFFKLYMPILDQWAVYENSGQTPQIIAKKNGKKIIENEALWQNFLI